MKFFSRTLILVALLGTPATQPDGMARASSRNGDKQMLEQEGSAGKLISKSGYDLTPLSPEEVEGLAGKLTPEQYRITQRSGTEAAFCGTLLDNRKDGVYTCVVCSLPLFNSEHKFKSGTGWPSFHSPFDPEHLGERTDSAHGMVRSEIFCRRCGAHTGHVFPDGPPPSGLRYCLNSAALDFIEQGQALPPGAALDEQPGTPAYFAGGCFWGVEYAFSQVPGVLDAESGYQNGGIDDPNYREVCSGRTGHAEVVKVLFDQDRISYEKLLRFFFLLHDPTQLNRQGPDVGSQYRSAIFTVDEAQQRVAELVIDELQKTPEFENREIVTVVEEARTFWPAEECHQDYVERTGRACHVNLPDALEAIGVSK